MFVYIVADVSSGLPCDKDGYDIPNGPHPPRIDKSGPIDFTPFETGAEFEFAEFLYSKAEMSAGKIDKLLEILAALYPERTPSIADHKDLYQRIDSIQQGDIAWDSFSVKYNCNLLTPGAPKLLWMEQTFEVWFCDPLRVLKNQIGNPNFEDEIDYAPKQIYYKGKHRYENLMSRNWAWEQADKIAQDEATHGAMFAPVVLGSDKTTVSVATGQNDYYPLYISLGNVHNTVRCTALPTSLDAMGAVPQTHVHTDVLVNGGGIELQELWDDYGIVGDIIPFTTRFLRADIHELLAPDLLHQVIKGTFKDHIVLWVEKYIRGKYPKVKAEQILADIDRRISVVPSFPGLCHFYQGRGFKQWTGDDSKGLMKVYLPAISGHLPLKMVQAISALISFCYLVCRNIIDEDTLAEIKKVLGQFHEHCEIFLELGATDTLSLPCQHSITHYPFLITQFGAPNRLCSSITESMHIPTTKHTFCRSNCNKPLGQMLVTNQRVDKLTAACTDFASRGMLDGPCVVGPLLDLVHSRYPPDDNRASPQPAQHNIQHNAQHNKELDDGGAINEAVDKPESYSEITMAKTYVRNLPRDIYALARHTQQIDLPLLTQCFLYSFHHPQSPIPASHIPEDQLLPPPSKVHVHTSVRTVFYVPSAAMDLP
ncbi:hypothetical protein V8E53_015770 [Lactarius tabidus]